MRWGCQIILAVVLFLMLILSALPLYASAGLLTEVTVETEPTAEVNVEPGSSGLAFIAGIVNVTNYNTATPLTVALAVESTVGVTTIDKTQMSFQGSKDTEEISLTITVPIVKTLASDEHSLTVSGTWQQGATTGAVVADTTQVIVLPYYLPEILSPEPAKQVVQGESTSFDLRINNSGNILDTYSLGIENSEDLNSNGISIQVDDEIDVEAKEYEEIEVDVRTSSDTSSKKYTIWIVVTSMESDGLVQEKYPLVIRVRAGVFGVDVISLAIVGIIVAVAVAGIVVYKKKKK